MSNFNNFQDPAQGPRPEQDPMVNGVQSGSQSDNDGNNKGQFNDSYQQMPAGGYPPVGSQTAHRFFNWVRNAYLRRRSDDRWIGREIKRVSMGGYMLPPTRRIRITLLFLLQQIILEEFHM